MLNFLNKSSELFCAPYVLMILMKFSFVLQHFFSGSGSWSGSGITMELNNGSYALCIKDAHKIWCHSAKFLSKSKSYTHILISLFMTRFHVIRHYYILDFKQSGSVISQVNGPLRLLHLESVLGVILSHVVTELDLYRFSLFFYFSFNLL